MKTSAMKMPAAAFSVMLALALGACGGNSAKPAEPSSSSEPAASSSAAAPEAEAKIMSFDEYKAAAIDDPVYVESYVQAKQSWWDNKATLYLQDENGAIFVYDANCSQEDYDKLTEGTQVRVKGYKTEWSGETEIAEGASIEIVEGSTFVAEANDVTELLGTDTLIDHQNEKIAIKGLTVAASTDADGKEAAFLYNYDGSGKAGENDDLYFNVTDGTNIYNMTVESYLTGEDSDVYKAVTQLKIGDTVDLEGFLYWYEGPNPHITSVTVK